MAKAISSVFQLSLCTLGCLYVFNDNAIAQIIPDGTVNTQVNQNGNVAEITGGETRGGNLFHSFNNFSVPTGNEAFFNNVDSISNIFSRVTGGNISNIDGIIRANSSASLFLINPAGIIFGENSRLDIGGSFYGSTASSILFEDGEFSVADLDNPPLLTVNAPIGLGFRDNPSNIINRSKVDSSGLQVVTGKNIALLGGNINLEGGFVSAPEGTITLGGLNTTGEISITETNSFVFPEGIAKSNVFVTEGSEVNVRGEVGGLIQVNANNLEIIEESNFLAGILLNAGSPNVQSRDINLNLNNLIVSGNSNIRNETFGIGNAGNINITTGDLNLTEGAAIIASTFGQGNGGDVNINATGDVSIDRDFGGIYSTVGIRKDEREPNITNVVGDAGDITISANSFSLTNGSRLSTKTAGRGNAGNVEINATDRVLLDGKGTIPIEAGGFSFNIATAILTQVETENEEGTTFSGMGNAGNIEINAGSLLVTTAEGQFFGPQINTDNRGGIGNAGNVEINITDSIVLEGKTQINTEISQDAVGDAGNINIATDLLTMRDDSQLITFSRGEGNSGDIKITATGQVVLEGNNNDTAKLNTQVQPGAISESAGNIEVKADSLFFDNRALLLSGTQGDGDGGDISIQVNSFSLDQRSELSSLAQQGTGNAGDIIVNAEQQIVLDGNSKFLSQVFDGAEGNAGNIEITTSQLALNDFSQISSNTQEGAMGDAGSTSIVTETLTLTGGSTIDSTTDNDFSGGNIDITASQVELSQSGKIVTSTSGQGNAGSIELNVSDDILIDNSNPLLNTPFSEEILQDLKSDTGIFASAGEESNGNGGSVQISVSDHVLIKNGGRISVENQGQGNGGSLFIQANAIDLNDNASISAATSSGTGSNITLRTFDDITLRENSFISAEASGDAQGGNITIDSQFIIAFPSNVLGRGNDILANAIQGNGGNITINAESLFGIQERNATEDNTTNDIDASSARGAEFNGIVNINTLDTSVLQSDLDLPRNLVQTDQTNAQACRNNRELAAKNSFNVTGKGGIVPEPGSPLNSLNVTVNGESTSAKAIPAPIETSQGKIQPARGVEITESGGVILTAYRTNNAGERLPKIKRNCSSS